MMKTETNTKTAASKKTLAVGFFLVVKHTCIGAKLNPTWQPPALKKCRKLLFPT